MTSRESVEETIARLSVDVPDFPKPGVVFKDLSSLLADAQAFAEVVDALAGSGRDGDGRVAVDHVLGIEARGFIFGAPVALELGVGFVPVRKPGKLPRETFSETYALEYGDDTVHMHRDALAPGARVLVVDDVLATGGTLAAVTRLVAQADAHVHAIAVVMELGFLPGRETVGDVRLASLLTI
jgi:adenine phosphoribosyltransferase